MLAILGNCPAAVWSKVLTTPLLPKYSSRTLTLLQQCFKALRTGQPTTNCTLKSQRKALKVLKTARQRINRASSRKWRPPTGKATRKTTSFGIDQSNYKENTLIRFCYSSRADLHFSMTLQSLHFRSEPSRLTEVAITFESA